MPRIVCVIDCFWRSESHSICPSPAEQHPLDGAKAIVVATPGNHLSGRLIMVQLALSMSRAAGGAAAQRAATSQRARRSSRTMLHLVAARSWPLATTR